MIGAIAGDIIGSVYEYIPMKRTDFPLFKKNSSFADDSILTIATANPSSMEPNMQDYIQRSATITPRQDTVNSLTNGFFQKVLSHYIIAGGMAVQCV